jgi:4'-phosphopantetheinyl transferase
MTILYFSHIESALDKALFRDYLARIPAELGRKATNFRRWQDSHASLFGKLLLLEGLKEFGHRPDLEGIRYGQYLKPFFDNGVQFNISHSGEYVVCIMSTVAKVGIDIEKVQRVTVDDFKPYFLEPEYNEIISADDPCSKFFEYWTRKEAVVKADGMGLKMPLDSFCVQDDTVQIGPDVWHIHRVNFTPGYHCHAALSGKPGGPIQIRKFNFYDQVPELITVPGHI